MVFKTFALGIPLIVSRTSPTALAVERAWEAGITLIGYLRGSQFDIYSHPERLRTEG
jgi:FdhD protein